MIQKFNNWIKLNESKNNFTNKIDYTCLKDNITIDDVKQLCEDADENGFYAVCIKPDFVGTAQAFLDDSEVKVCTVISFPKGDDTTRAKMKETDEAIKSGADEIDMVMDYNKLKELSFVKDEEYEKIYEEVLDDVRGVAKICHSDGVILKVIIETEELNFNQIKTACDICVSAGADFVKTSTGKSKTQKPFQDKVDKIKYMRKILPEYVKIKVSGGIRNMENINQVLPYVDRIGTSIIIEE